jgi:hypothetical protein
VRRGIERQICFGKQKPPAIIRGQPHPVPDGAGPG